MNTLTKLAEEVIGGRKLTSDEALAVLRHENAEELYAAANDIRRACCGNQMNYCSIINARSGKCPEDCKWCSQSHVHHTGIDEYDIVDADKAVDMALHNAAKGVHRFSLVTSGRTVTDAELDKFLEIYTKIRQQSNIALCASMGLLTKPQLQRLRDAGISHYHHNIETAPSFFAQLVTTHTIEDKLRTIGYAKEVGLEICSGVIIGMGESEEQRVEMATVLRDLEVKSIPVNTLMPIKGTKLESRPILDNESIFRTMAMFRFVNPNAEIRMAGGRKFYHAEQKTALCAGVNASIVGDMLTTIGAKSIEEDMRDLRLD